MKVQITAAIHPNRETLNLPLPKITALLLVFKVIEPFDLKLELDLFKFKDPKGTFKLLKTYFNIIKRMRMTVASGTLILS